MTREHCEVGRSERARTPRLSRAEIETLCVLYSIGTGCEVPELTARLGLSSALAPVVAEAVAELVRAGDITVDSDLVTLSAAGRERLDAQLSRLGVR